MNQVNETLRTFLTTAVVRNGLTPTAVQVEYNAYGAINNITGKITIDGTQQTINWNTDGSCTSHGPDYNYVVRQTLADFLGTPEVTEPEA